MTRTEQIAAIRNLPAQIQEIIAALPTGAIDRPYHQGGWTGCQVIHHLADAHLNAYIRTKLIAEEERPALKTWAQDDWATLPDAKGPAESSLAILRGLHARWAEFFDNLTEADWKRVGLHPQNGEQSIESILETYANHCATHLNHLKALQSAG